MLVPLSVKAFCPDSPTTLAKVDRTPGSWRSSERLSQNKH
jgi:hypothetical protein